MDGSYDVVRINLSAYKKRMRTATLRSTVNPDGPLPDEGIGRARCADYGERLCQRQRRRVPYSAIRGRKSPIPLKLVAESPEQVARTGFRTHNLAAVRHDVTSKPCIFSNRRWSQVGNPDKFSVSQFEHKTAACPHDSIVVCDGRYRHQIAA